MVNLYKRVAAILTVFVLGFAGLTASAHAVPFLVSDITFNGSIVDTQSNSTLTVYGDTGSGGNGPSNSSTYFAADAFGQYWSWTSNNSHGGGLTVDAPLISTADYSLGIRFSFSDMSGYRKIVDFFNRTSDSGLYFLSGKLGVFPTPFGSTIFQTNRVYDLIITRDGGSNTFIAYLVDDTTGTVYTEQNFVDGTGYTVPAIVSAPDARFGLFHDDTSTSSEATTSGKVYAVRIWDGVVPPGSVQTALGPIVGVQQQPVPAVSTGGLLLLMSFLASGAVVAMVRQGRSKH